MTDYLKAVGLNVNAKELTSGGDARERQGGALRHQHGMGRALRADADRRHRALHALLFRHQPALRHQVEAVVRHATGPPARSRRTGSKRMFDIAKEWKTVVPGSDRYTELGKELVKLNLENMTIIGTIGALPKPVIVSNRLHNVKTGIARCISTSATIPVPARPVVSRSEACHQGRRFSPPDRRARPVRGPAIRRSNDTAILPRDRLGYMALTLLLVSLRLLPRSCRPRPATTPRSTPRRRRRPARSSAQADIEAVRAQLGLDQPWYRSNTAAGSPTRLHGDFGYSWAVEAAGRRGDRRAHAADARHRVHHALLHVRDLDPGRDLLGGAPLLLRRLHARAFARLSRPRHAELPARARAHVSGPALFRAERRRAVLAGIRRMRRGAWAQVLGPR